MELQAPGWEVNTQRIKKHIGLLFPFLLHIDTDVITDAIYRFVFLKKIFLSFLPELAFVKHQIHEVRKEIGQGTEGLRWTVTVMLDSHVTDAVSSRWKDTSPEKTDRTTLL